jgi:hypothetical protein
MASGLIHGKLYFSLDRAKVTSVSVRGEIEANPPRKPQK